MVGHAAKGKAVASRDATLLALVVIVILLSGQGISGSNDGFGIAPRVAQILTLDDTVLANTLKPPLLHECPIAIRKSSLRS